MNEASTRYPVSGAGLGLRRPIADKLMADPPDVVDFMEVAPENWIHVGGALGKKFRWFTERYPFVIHGLSLSIGAPSPLNEQLVLDIKAFMAEHGIHMYSEHLSYCGDDGQLYDSHADPVHRGSGQIRGGQGSSCAGHPRAADRARERVLLRTDRHDAR